MKKTIAFLLLAALLLALAACSGGGTGTTTVVSTGDAGLGSGVTAETVSVQYDAEDLEASTAVSDVTYIELHGQAITLDGSGATVDGTVVTIAAAGTYNIRGTLDDGQVVVDTQDQETVRLILNGADLTCSTGAPIYVAQAEKVVITLAADTANHVTDGAAYSTGDAESDGPNAAIYSHDDLTINGDGALTVDANYNGIASKDDCKITAGRITVNAAHDGIKGKDSLAIKDGTIIVHAGADGLQADNDVDVGQGYIVIEGGILQITAGLDGIQAESTVTLSGGDITVVAGGGSANGASGGAAGGWEREAVSTDSAKGIKAGQDLTITGGAIQIDAADDALHADASLTVAAGGLTLRSGDDGVHAETLLTIAGGDLRVVESYEGLESETIAISGGTIHVTAGDDGINGSSGGGGDVGMGGRPGWGEAAGSSSLTISDGYLYVDARGDGLDVNGPITMSGGVVIVNGPTSDGNGALDYSGEFQVTGGLLVAVGSAGMAMAPGAPSTQYVVLVNLAAPQAAGTLVHLAAQNGEGVLTLAPTKSYQSLVLCSPELEKGASYVVYTGGSSSGTATDGLYSGGTYTGGTESASLTISGIVTGAGAYGGGFPGGGGMPPGGGGMPPGGGRPGRP